MQYFIRNHILVVFIVFVLYLTLSSCKQDKPEAIHGNELFNNKESYIKANEYLVKKDAEQIKSYVERRGWNMTQSESGLWYMIYKNGNGETASSGKLIRMNYSTTLLDGTFCYSSDQNGPKEFIIGQGGVESGLEEGVLLLKEGDNAKFIIPPHLGHGLLGDSKKIPPRAIIVYDVEVLSISEP